MRLVLASTLRETDNCIDIGAAAGDFLTDIYRYAPYGNHIAYEPLPGSVDALRHRFPDATIRQVAVSDATGEATFVEVENASGWSGFRSYEYQIGKEARTSNQTVMTVSLDDDLPSDYVPALIKIDVNGAEESVFRGAVRTITSHGPTVIFEHGMAAKAYGTSSAQLYALLTEECGLRIYTLDGIGPLNSDELSGSTWWNFLARPR